MTISDRLRQARSTATSMSSELPTSSVPVAAGFAAFGSTLALSTLTQLKVLGVSTGSPAPIPTVFGIVSVALASLASHQASIRTFELAQKHGLLTMPRLQRHFTENEQDDWTRQRRDNIKFGDIQISTHSLRICALGLIVFKLLGGRFWAIAPSSYTSLGSFARFSLPATERYASASQRASIERLGRLVGCHTCGSRMLFKRSPRFIADHMPPKAVAQQMNNRFWRRLFNIKVKYRFFPQCVRCSSAQGGILSTASQQKGLLPFAKPNLAGAGGGRMAHFHGFRVRVSHLTGGVLAGVTVMGATPDEIATGSRKQFQDLQDQLEEWVVDAWAFLRRIRF